MFNGLLSRGIIEPSPGKLGSNCQAVTAYAEPAAEAGKRPSEREGPRRETQGQETGSRELVVTSRDTHTGLPAQLLMAASLSTALSPEYTQG